MVFDRRRRRAKRAPLTGSKPRKKEAFLRSTALSAKLLSPLMKCGSCPHEADNVFAGAESRAILLSSPATGQSGVGRLSSGCSAAVNDLPGKSLKLQKAPSSEALTSLDKT
jgi:hypothetical protein